MSKPQEEHADNFEDLDFDIDKHREAIGVFAAFGFGSPSVKAGLKARDVAFVQFKSGQFGIGLTDNPTAQEANQRSTGCIHFKVIHQARDMEEVEQVRDDVEQYFLRHFPGRCLNWSQGHRDIGSDKENCVYIAIFHPRAE